MNLFVDTETSGLWRDDLDATSPDQPHLVQLGAQLFDRQWNRRGHLSLLIRPDGWEIEQGAEAVHGISTQVCSRYGVTLAEALIPLRGLVAAANRVVGHHMQFDRRVIAAAAHRAGGAGEWWTRIGAKFLCTMEASTEVCAIPAQFGGFKWPTLDEALAKLTTLTLPERHDVDTDIAGTVAIYRELIARDIIKEADPFARAVK